MIIIRIMIKDDKNTLENNAVCQNLRFIYIFNNRYIYIRKYIDDMTYKCKDTT